MKRGALNPSVFIQLQTFAALRAVPPAAEVSGLCLSGNTQEDLCNAGKGLRTGGLPNLEAIHAKSITGKSWAGKLRASRLDGEVEWVLLLGASLFGVMGDETPVVGKKRP